VEVFTAEANRLYLTIHIVYPPHDTHDRDGARSPGFDLPTKAAPF